MQKKKSLLNRLFSTIESKAWPLRVSLWRTVYFNFRSLPFDQARRFPIYIYQKTRFQTLSGNVELDGPVTSGMIRIGKSEDRGNGVTTIRNHGLLRLGAGTTIMQGCDLYIGPMGVIDIGQNCRIREGTFIYASQMICIGHLCGIAFQTTISDDDFHFVLDTESGRIANCKEPIRIGNRNWIGSRTVIKKGTITPDNTIVASSNSILDRDYTKSVPEYSVIGGVPARLLRRNMRRIFNKSTERDLHREFQLRNSDYMINHEDLDIDDYCI